MGSSLQMKNGSAIVIVTGQNNGWIVKNVQHGVLNHLSTHESCCWWHGCLWWEWPSRFSQERWNHRCRSLECWTPCNASFTVATHCRLVATYLTRSIFCVSSIFCSCFVGDTSVFFKLFICPDDNKAESFRSSLSLLYWRDVYSYCFFIYYLIILCILYCIIFFNNFSFVLNLDK